MDQWEIHWSTGPRLDSSQLLIGKQFSLMAPSGQNFKSNVGLFPGFPANCTMLTYVLRVNSFFMTFELEYLKSATRVLSFRMSNWLTTESAISCELTIFSWLVKHFMAMLEKKVFLSDNISFHEWWLIGPYMRFTSTTIKVFKEKKTRFNESSTFSWNAWQKTDMNSFGCRWKFRFHEPIS